MRRTNDGRFDERKFLICETFKKRNGGYPELNLLPLCNDERYGTLFLGAEMIGGYCEGNDSNFVWRFSSNGVERARVINGLDDLHFLKTEYSLCTKMEDKVVGSVFGPYFENYKKMMDQYSTGRVGRLQRYVSPHPQLEKLKGRAIANPQKVAAIVLAAGIAITSGTAAIVCSNDKENVAPMPQPTQQIEQVATATPVPAEYEEISNEMLDDTSVIVEQKSQADLQFEQYSNSILQKIDNLKDSGRLTKEYNYFYKYSSTLNPNLQPQGKGEFASIEELLESYSTDPERFALYSQRFLEDMNLDYMKIKLAEAHGIPNPDEIKLTYENPIGAFEIRVRHNGRDLELPAYGVKRSPSLEPIDKVEGLFQGSRFSKLSLDKWATFFKIRETEAYAGKSCATSQYTQEEYNEFLVECIGDINNNMEELFPQADLELTVEDDGR